MVAFHGLMSTGGAVAAVPAFEPWSKLWGISINSASYIGSAQVRKPSAAKSVYIF